jgi:hypothetical protein
MIKLILIPLAVMLSCGSTKSTWPVLSVDSAAVAEKTKNDSLHIGGEETKLPTCIKNKLDSFKLKEIHERPQKMVEYSYKGKKVYYVVMACCDFFNEVYDEHCKFLGSPDGGFTGKGDGKLPDFFEEAKNEKLIWEAAK